MTRSRPVVFIHGMWLHATSWAAWTELFAAAGHHATAPGWPGEPDTIEQARENPEAVADHSIDDVVDHFTTIAASSDDPPLVIGHSFGALIAQELLRRDVAAAAVAIDPAHISGVLPRRLSTIESALPVWKNPANRHRAVSLTVQQFRNVFGAAVSEEESAALFHRWNVPSPGRPLFEAHAGPFRPPTPTATHTTGRAQETLLVMVSGTDDTIAAPPAGEPSQQNKHFNMVTDLLQFPDRGHSLTIDGGWPDVAAAALHWLHQQPL